MKSRTKPGLLVILARDFRRCGCHQRNGAGLRLAAQRSGSLDRRTRASDPLLSSVGRPRGDSNGVESDHLKGAANSRCRLEPRFTNYTSRSLGQNRIHWITWSARAMTENGNLIPSAWAVLRFTMSAIRVGCSNGVVAGSAPLTTRSTTFAQRRNASSMSNP